MTEYGVERFEYRCERLVSLVHRWQTPLFPLPSLLLVRRGHSPCVMFSGVNGVTTLHAKKKEAHAVRDCAL